MVLKATLVLLAAAGCANIAVGQGVLSGAETVDLLLIFDRTSVGADGERITDCLRSAAAQITNGIASKIAADGVRVAAVSFGGNAGAGSTAAGRVHFDFSTGSSPAAVTEGIETADLSTRHSWTDAAPGFAVARTELLSGTAAGFREFQVPLVVIVLTDGQVSFDPYTWATDSLTSAAGCGAGGRLGT